MQSLGPARLRGVLVSNFLVKRGVQLFCGQDILMLAEHVLPFDLSQSADLMRLLKQAVHFPRRLKMAWALFNSDLGDERVVIVAGI